MHCKEAIGHGGAHAIVAAGVEADSNLLREKILHRAAAGRVGGPRFHVGRPRRLLQQQ